MSKQEIKLRRVLNLFKDKCKDHQAKKYKSFSAMRRADGRYTIMLMFGYTKDKSRNPIYSESIEVNDIELYLEFQRVLDFGLIKDVVQGNVFEGIEDD